MKNLNTIKSCKTLNEALIFYRKSHPEVAGKIFTDICLQYTYKDMIVELSNILSNNKLDREICDLLNIKLHSIEEQIKNIANNLSLKFSVNLYDFQSVLNELENIDLFNDNNSLLKISNKISYIEPLHKILSKKEETYYTKKDLEKAYEKGIEQGKKINQIKKENTNQDIDMLDL